MADYILSKKASEDLIKIWYYTMNIWSEEQADIYYQNFIQSFEYIAQSPDSVGRSYDGVRTGYRGFRSGKHIIFYRILKNGKVRIIRILHERMDFRRYL